MIMRRPLLTLALLVVGCGSSAPPTAIGKAARGPRPASTIFIGAGDHRIMAVGCWDPARGTIAGADACAELAAPIVMGSDGARYRVTGRLSDECPVSEPTRVAAIAPETVGTGSGEPALAVAPPEVDLGYRALPPAFDVDRKPTAPPLAAEVRAAIAARATADLVGTAGETEIEPDALEIAQVVDVDLDGDRVVDRLVSANVPAGYADFVWSGLVLLPGKRAADARTLWHDTVQVITVEATFELDGDGVPELMFTGEYYESSRRGIARIADGALVIIGSYGCGS